MRSIEFISGKEEICGMRIEAYSQIQNLYNASRPAARTGQTATADFRDKLQISGEGRAVQVGKEALAAAPDIREDKVAAIKAQYENGTYDVSGEDFAERILEKSMPLTF